MYGLLGIMEDVDTDEDIVNYTSSVPEVYANFIRTFIRSYSSLRFLCHFNRQDDALNLPSWLPAPNKGSWHHVWDIGVSCSCGSITADNASVFADTPALIAKGILVDRIMIVNQEEGLGQLPFSTWTRQLQQH